MGDILQQPPMFSAVRPELPQLRAMDLCICTCRRYIHVYTLQTGPYHFSSVLYMYV